MQCEYGHIDYMNTFIHDHLCAQNEYNYIIADKVILEDVAHIHFARRPMNEHAAAVVQFSCSCTIHSVSAGVCAMNCVSLHGTSTPADRAFYSCKHTFLNPYRNCFNALA